MQSTPSRRTGKGPDVRVCRQKRNRVASEAAKRQARVMATLVYLDQNKWIDLAKIVHGRSNDLGLKLALDAARESVHAGLASFPLSLAHFTELHHRIDRGSRERLGSVMLELSRGHTMLTAEQIVRDEIRHSVATIVTGRMSAPSTAFGYGLSFMVGRPDLGGSFDAVSATLGMPAPALHQLFEAVLLEWVLAGPPEDAEPVSLNLPRDVDDRYVAEKRQLAQNLSDAGRTRELARRLSYGVELRDTAKMTIQAFEEQDASVDLLLDGGFDVLKGFIDGLPTASIIRHLHEAALMDPNLIRQSNDFNDVMYLCAAAAHCDVVVGERKWINQIRRSGAPTRAALLTDVRELPSALAARSNERT